MCANESVLLGKANLNINSLTKKEKFDLSTKPIIIDEVLRLQSVNQKQPQIVQNNDDMPIIGVQVILRKENVSIDGLILNGEQHQQHDSFKSNNNIYHDESTPKKSDKNLTPNVTPIKSNLTINNEDDEDDYEEDKENDGKFLRTPSPVAVQQTTVTKHVNPPVPSSARYHFENPEKVVQQKQQPNSNNENVYNEELQLRAAYEIQLWKEAREKEFDQYVCNV